MGLFAGIEEIKEEPLNELYTGAMELKTLPGVTSVENLSNVRSVKLDGTKLKTTYLPGVGITYHNHGKEREGIYKIVETPDKISLEFEGYDGNFHTNMPGIEKGSYDNLHKLLHEIHITQLESDGKIATGENMIKQPLMMEIDGKKVPVKDLWAFVKSAYTEFNNQPLVDEQGKIVG